MKNALIPVTPLSTAQKLEALITYALTQRCVLTRDSLLPKPLLQSLMSTNVSTTRTEALKYLAERGSSEPVTLQQLTEVTGKGKFAVTQSMKGLHKLDLVIVFQGVKKSDIKYAINTKLINELFDKILKPEQ